MSFRNYIACFGKLYSYRSGHYNIVARMQSAENLHHLTVIGPDGDKMLLVALFVELGVDEIFALMFGKCVAGNCQDIVA